MSGSEAVRESRGDQSARSHDDPLTVLPLDPLHPAKTGKGAVAGNLEDIAVVILDERMPAAMVVSRVFRTFGLG